MALSTQSTTLKGYEYHGGRVFIFSSSGVDIYKPSRLGFTRIGFASLANVTSGSVNDNGIWLGTSDAGVWHCPNGAGNLTTQLLRFYAVSGTTYGVQNNNIAGVAGNGTALIVTHASGVDFYPYIGERHQYSSVPAKYCTLNDTYIAYSTLYTGFDGVETILLPTDDWTTNDATRLFTSTTPALSSNTTNGLRYGSGNNLFIATGDGVDIYDYTDITTIGSGNVPYVWPCSDATQSAGCIAYIDSNNDAITYDISSSSTIESITGTFSQVWLDDSVDLQLSDADLERHLYIDNITPINDADGVSRSWSLYFEIGDDIYGLSSSNVTVKVNGVTVSPTFTPFASGFSSGFSSGFGGEGFKVTYTPVSASGYRKTVIIEISGTDNNGDSFSESISFTTETSVNSDPATTKPPSVIVYKDLSLTTNESEDVYSSTNVNWLDEEQSQLYVTEDQAKASAQVMVENGYYHKHVLNIQVYDTDDSSNNTQDIKVGDIITIDVTALGLTNQKCEVLSKQRVTDLDRILYNMSVAYYEVWS